MQRGADTKELKLVHPLKDYHVAVEYSTNLLQNVRASSSAASRMCDRERSCAQSNRRIAAK